MLSLLISVLICIAVGALAFYLIHRFVHDRRLKNLLKILVVLFLALAILRILLPPLGLGALL